MVRSRPSTALALVVVSVATVLLAMAGCGSGEETPAAPSPPDVSAIPHPETQHMEVPVKERFDQVREALEREPGSDKAWGAYGALCDSHSFYECADYAYSRAQELGPRDFRWFYLRAFVGEVSGAASDRVVEDYRTAARLEPRLPTTYYRLGEAATRAGLLDEAEQAYRSALAVDPNLVVARRGLGQVLLAKGDAGGAVEELQRAVELGARRNAATLASLARAQQRLGDSTAAEATAVRAAEADEEIPVPDPVRLRVREMNLSSKECNHRAVQLIQAGRYEEALVLMRIVERTLPDRPSTHYRIGLCLVRSGKLAEGLPRLERAAELAPDNEIVRVELERARAELSGADGR